MSTVHVSCDTSAAAPASGLSKRSADVGRRSTPTHETWQVSHPWTQQTQQVARDLLCGAVHWKCRSSRANQVDIHQDRSAAPGCLAASLSAPTSPATSSSTWNCVHGGPGPVSAADVYHGRGWAAMPSSLEWPPPSKSCLVQSAPRPSGRSLALSSTARKFRQADGVSVEVLSSLRTGGLTACQHSHVRCLSASLPGRGSPSACPPAQRLLATELSPRVHS